MTAVCFPLFFGTTSLYVYVTTIACSQLEKLKVAIMNINRDQDTDAEEKHEKRRSQGVLRTSHDVFRHTHEQITYCIRHHQQILEYDTPNSLDFGSGVFEVSVQLGCNAASLVIGSRPKFEPLKRGHIPEEGKSHTPYNMRVT
jgi:hypothetical protein